MQSVRDKNKMLKLKSLILIRNNLITKSFKNINNKNQKLNIK